MFRFLRFAIALTFVITSTLCFSQPTLTPQNSGTTNRLQAISPVNSKVVWASGVAGTYALTTDGGATWHAGVVPGAEALQFRDVEGISGKVAYLLASGVGTDSRIYKTENGGQTWMLQFTNQDPAGFDDCFSFWTPKRGLTFADSIEGRFPVLRTTDGKKWHDIGNRLPPALPGEAGFAASGTCVATQGKLNAWIGTGGAEKARILATTNGGETWNAYETPIVQGTPISGIFTVAFRDAYHGILGGGDLAATAPLLSDKTATSHDGGHTWQLTSQVPVPGAIYGLSYAKTRDNLVDDEDGNPQHANLSKGNRDESNARTVVVTGPGGAAWTPDEGGTWNLLSGVTGYWAVAFANSHDGWLVGTQGRILKITF